MLQEVNMCSKRLICALGGEFIMSGGYVPQEAIVSRGRRTFVVLGGYVL